MPKNHYSLFNVLLLKNENGVGWGEGCLPRSLKVEAPGQNLSRCLWFLLASACSGPEEHTAHLVPSLGHPGWLLLFGCDKKAKSWPVLAPSWAPATRKCQSHLLMELPLLVATCKGRNLGREGYSSILSFFSFPWCLGDVNLAVLNPAIIYCNFFCLMLFLLLKVLLFSLLSTGILFPLIGGKFEKLGKNSLQSVCSPWTLLNQDNIRIQSFEAA